MLVAVIALVSVGATVLVRRSTANAPANPWAVAEFRDYFAEWVAKSTEVRSGEGAGYTTGPAPEELERAVALLACPVASPRRSPLAV